MAVLDGHGDGAPLPTEAPAAPDAVDVVLAVLREVHVEDVLHLLDIDAARQGVGRDQHDRVLAPSPKL